MDVFHRIHQSGGRKERGYQILDIPLRIAFRVAHCFDKIGEPLQVGLVDDHLGSGRNAHSHNFLPFIHIVFIQFTFLNGFNNGGGEAHGGAERVSPVVRIPPITDLDGIRLPTGPHQGLAHSNIITRRTRAGNMAVTGHIHCRHHNGRTGRHAGQGQIRPRTPGSKVGPPLAHQRGEWGALEGISGDVGRGAHKRQNERQRVQRGVHIAQLHDGGAEFAQGVGERRIHGLISSVNADVVGRILNQFGHPGFERITV